MNTESNLPTRLAAYQNACFDGEEYIGFQCPTNCGTCPLKRGDGLEIIDGFKKINGLMELDHSDGSRFSKTRTTYANQVTPMCSICHTDRHAGDPSASRLKRM